MLRIIKFDLYRFFFPMGWLLGFWGAFLWILFALNFIDYPGALHPEIMMGGFLLCFVSGFLTTAAPKFTDSYPPTITDLRLSVIFTSLLFISLIFHEAVYFRFAVLLQFLFLAWFVGNRFFKRKSNPPVVFLFIGFGLLSGIAGNILLITGHFVELGRLLFLHAYVLSFVLGIGSRLIPALLGAEISNFKMKTVFAVAVVFFSSFFIESFISSYYGSMLRSLIILLIAILAWKIHQLPKRKAFQSWGLWISCWSLVIGSLGANFFPDYRIHLLHLVFISGLSMLTLMIATRVSLSHGKHDMSLEMKSRQLQAAIFLFILAALARVSAGFIPTFYEYHLTCAALIWIAGLILWGWAFLPKIIYTKI
jgi:uncharacterized protein involved in response to NO